MENLKDFFENLPKINGIEVLNKAVTVNGENLDDKLQILNPNDILKVKNFYVANSTVCQIPFTLSLIPEEFVIHGIVRYDCIEYFTLFSQKIIVWLITEFKSL